MQKSNLSLYRFCDVRSIDSDLSSTSGEADQAANSKPNKSWIKASQSILRLRQELKECLEWNKTFDITEQAPPGQMYISSPWGQS